MRLCVTKIRIEMARLNLNQKMLAEKADIQRSTLCRILRDKSAGNIMSWSKIASALGVDVTELIEN